jgi:hypothetical protein
MPEDALAILPTLLCSCGSLFFAAVAVGFLVLLLYSGRKRQQLRATLANIPLRSIATLRPGQGLVRLKGVIAQVPEPMPPLQDVAVLRVLSRIKIVEEKQQSDRVQVRSFLLDDGSGTVWVDPTGVDRYLLGKAAIPEGADRADALEAVGLPKQLARGYMEVWALRVGQEVTVVGTVQQRGEESFIAKEKGQPLVISPGDVPEMLTQAGRQSTVTWVVSGVLGLIALCLLGAFGLSLVRILSQLLSGK